MTEEEIIRKYGGKVLSSSDEDSIINKYGGKIPGKVQGASQKSLGERMGQVSSFYRGIPSDLGNEGMIQEGAKFLGETGPPAVGAMIGAGLGGGIPGAMVGAAAGGTLRDLFMQIFGNEPTPPLLESFKRRITDMASGGLQEAIPAIKGLADLSIGGVPGSVQTGLSMGGKISGELGKDVTTPLIKGIKPAQSKTEFRTTLESAIHDLDSKTPIKTIDDLRDALVSSKIKIWERFTKIFGPNSAELADVTKIADEMESTITPRTLRQNPSLAGTISEKAKQYREMGKMPLKQLEKEIEEANGELHSYYNMMKINRATALKDPSVAYKVKEVEAMRSILDEKINSLSGNDPNIGLLKKRYGELRNLQDSVLKRYNVAKRQNPDALIEQFGSLSAGEDLMEGLLSGRPIRGTAKAIGKKVLSHRIKVGNTTDALIEKAFKAYNSGETKLPRDEYIMKILPWFSRSLFDGNSED